VSTTAALLADEVLGDVGHAQRVFVMPQMLRPYVLHHRKLLGALTRAAWETLLKQCQPRKCPVAIGGAVNK